jgi:hypothetical protein
MSTSYRRGGLPSSAAPLSPPPLTEMDAMMLRRQ